MATVINNPGETTSGVGTMVGVIVGIVLVAVLFIYGLPMLRGGTTTTTSPTPGASANIDVTLPSANDSGNGGDTANQ